MKSTVSRLSVYFEKALALLRLRTVAAGLEVSDRILRLVYSDGRTWQLYAIRLEPGVVERGVIKKRDEFIAALKALKTKVGRSDQAKRMNVIACLDPITVYTQVFNLPVVRGQTLEEAVALNIQMASPLPPEESHSGWQVVGQNEGTLNLEILAAFVERRAVDEMIDALFEAGFLVMALESRALALARLLREKGAGLDLAKSYLFVNIDNAGMDFLIIRNGSLYFEYGNAWGDLMDEKGEISFAKFQATLAASLRQVMNFYGQHWKEPLRAVILSAIAFETEAERVIAATVPFSAVRLTLLMGQPISSEWLIALGCSLRSAGLRTNEQEISLLGEDSKDRFHEEQFANFMQFWRVLVPVSLSFVILTFAIGDYFLATTRTEIESRSDFQLAGRTAEISNLQASAKAFNQQVALLAAAEQGQSPKGALLSRLAAVAAGANVTITHLLFQSFGTPINMSGIAGSQDSVIAFKAALQKDPSVSAVNLPLTAIQTNGTGVVFTMTFIVAPTPRPAP